MSENSHSAKNADAKLFELEISCFLTIDYIVSNFSCCDLFFRLCCILLQTNFWIAPPSICESSFIFVDSAAFAATNLKKN